MLYLHKILPALVLPLGLCILLLGAALFWRKRILVLIPLMILLLASNPVVSSFLLSRLENQFPKVEIVDCPNADAIVVLSGILGDKRSSPESLELNWGEAFDRFDAGVRLFQAGKARWLILTDPRLPWDNSGNSPEGRELSRAATERGVPAARILLLGPIGNTAEETTLVAREAKTRGWQQIILVTTAWHMPRAAYLSSIRNLKIIPYPVDFQTSAERGRTSWLSWVPSAKALAHTEIYFREILGQGYYRFVARGSSIFSKLRSFCKKPSA